MATILCDTALHVAKMVNCTVGSMLERNKRNVQRVREKESVYVCKKELRSKCNKDTQAGNYCDSARK